MTDKQAVYEVLGRLPEGASLEEVIVDLHILISIRRGRADVAAGRTHSQEQVQQLMQSWVTAWTAETQRGFDAASGVCPT
jgi:hypothetical protein